MSGKFIQWPCFEQGNSRASSCGLLSVRAKYGLFHLFGTCLYWWFSEGLTAFTFTGKQLCSFHWRLPWNNIYLFYLSKIHFNEEYKIVIFYLIEGVALDFIFRKLRVIYVFTKTPWAGYRISVFLMRALYCSWNIWFNINFDFRKS